MALSIKKNKPDTPSLLLALIIYFIGVLVIASITYIVSRQDYIAEIDTRLIAAAENLPKILAADFHDRAIAADSIDHVEDEANLNELSNHAVTGGFAYLYTYVIQNNTAYFTASSYSANDTKYNIVSRYWTDYPEASPVFLTAIQSDKPVFDTSTDRWGTFRSVMIHFRSPTGNDYVAGADMEISIIKRSLRERVLAVIIIAILMLGLAFPFVRVFTRTYAAMNSELLKLNQQLNEDIERSRKAEQALRKSQDKR